VLGVSYDLFARLNAANGIRFSEAAKKEAGKGDVIKRLKIHD